MSSTVFHVVFAAPPSPHGRFRGQRGTRSVHSISAATRIDLDAEQASETAEHASPAGARAAANDNVNSDDERRRQ